MTDKTDEAVAMVDFFEKHSDKIAVAGPADCWLWTAAQAGKGYGHVQSRGKMRLAHREAFEAENGEGSAEGLVVRHKCDTPLCVNPSHLEIGTTADNNRDRDERGRQAMGEARGNAKLTEAAVQAIRSTYVPGSRTHGQYALARRFGVDRALIGRIIHRKLWRHVS